MILLGLNAYHGDVSAALIADGRLVAAVEEERFRRVKHWAGFPREAIRACLEIGGAAPSDVQTFAVSRNPRAHFLKKVAYALRHRPAPGQARDRARNWARVRELPAVIAQTLNLEEAQVRRCTRWVEHHPAHAASAYFVSPFDEAAVCTLDGFGDFVSTSFGVGRGNRIETFRRVFFPHSLGLLYLAITQYLGFPKYGDEYKVMGLAAYGEPEMADRLRKLIHLRADGTFRLDLSYFCHHTTGAPMTWDDGEPVLGPVWTPKLETLLGPARRPDQPIEPRHENVAASLQIVFEEVATHVLNALQRQTGLKRLCLAGGCAMNGVMNGKIRERTPFQDVYLQPAAGDNGTALGAAFHVWHQVMGHPREFVMRHAYWGPEFTNGGITAALQGARPELAKLDCAVRCVDDARQLVQESARRIADGDVVGWFEGRMEWGARALGNRSILADPRRADMRSVLNQKIKFRETFRPFAPSVRVEALDDWFVGAVPDPFMIQVYPVRPDKRNVIPAVTHVDGSGRLQTVDREANPLYWRLIAEFERLTGVPVLLNTSFNENEPIVHRPEEALDCFLRTRMDALVLGSYLIEKPRAPDSCSA